MLHAADSHVLPVPWLRKQHTVAAGGWYLRVDLQGNTTANIECWAYKDWDEDADEDESEGGGERAADAAAAAVAYVDAEMAEEAEEAGRQVFVVAAEGAEDDADDADADDDDGDDADEAAVQYMLVDDALSWDRGGLQYQRVAVEVVRVEEETML